MYKFNIVGLDFCPFIQPAIITLTEKKADFEITYTARGEKPGWLLKLSPGGATPLLAFGDKVLLESAVINDFIDEVTPGSLYPDDPYLKAQNRVWINHSYALLDCIYDVKTATREDSYETARQALIAKLAPLEPLLKSRRFFNGDDFSLTDTAYAPVFRTICILDEHFATGIMDCVPGLIHWSAAILSRHSVKTSVISNFAHNTVSSIRNSDAILAQRLNTSAA